MFPFTVRGIFMKAVVKTVEEPRVLDIKDVEIPKADAYEVLIRVRAASICGSDVSIYKMTPGFRGYAKIPIILGHELSGDIVDIGEYVKEVQIGDRVISESVIYCGNCFYCKKKLTNICANFKILGVHRDGGFAEYLVVPSRLMHKIPKTISYEEAALVEPTAVAVHAAVSRARIEPGDFIAILGPGPIGLLAAQIARSIGAGEVIVTGPGTSKGRLEIAEELGFKAVNIDVENPVEVVKEMTDNIGADVIFECAGSTKGMLQAYEMVRKDGQIVMVGIFSEAGEIPYTPIVRKEVRVGGSFCHTWQNYETAIKLIQKGLVKIRPLITHQFPLDEAKKAFEVILAKAGTKLCKVQLRP